MSRPVLLALGLCVAAGVDCLAGVLVAPTTVFMAEQRRTSRMTVKNPGMVPQEVEIRFSFGLPESDSLGNVRVVLSDTNVTDPRAALGWLRAFPKQVVVPPNGSQVIRLVADPPEGLADGEYWARIIVQSRDAQTNPTAAEAAEGISTQLNLIMQTAIMAKYRTGNLVCDLDLKEAKAWRDSTGVHVLADMENRGNASYVGLLTVRVLSDAKSVLAERKVDLAVYRNLARRVDIPLPETVDADARLQVSLEITNDGRVDIPPEDVLAGNTINTTVAVQP